MTSLSGADELSDPPSSRVPADHPGVNELFAVLAYGEVAAFYRLTDEARMAPDLRGRISMASMAAAEMGHYELLHDALESRGVDGHAGSLMIRATDVQISLWGRARCRRGTRTTLPARRQEPARRGSPATRSRMRAYGRCHQSREGSEPCRRPK